ncbi:MAG: RNA ligase family protein, partial [Nanoarchaeota archaeon]
RLNQNVNKKDKKKVRVNKIVENQFCLSRDVEQLGKYISNVKPDDIITISSKLHGCNCVIAKVLCKKPLKFYEKILKFLGVNIVDKHYNLVYSSRSVIKNAYADKQHNSFYDSDVWGAVANKYKDCIVDSLSIYGEIVGYTSTGSYIQKDYDYGCEKGQLDFYCFRITCTSTDGKVFEFSWQQIKDYCSKYNIKHVLELYYGKAGDLFDIEIDDNWHKNFLAELSNKFLEKKCKICKNNVPDEGIVLTVQSGEYIPYKYKSFLFKQRESDALDKGDVNMEDIESVNL